MSSVFLLSIKSNGCAPRAWGGKKMGRESDFWAVFKTTRQDDPEKGKVESLRRWARRCGIDVNVLIGWERGATPKVATLRAVADTLKVQPVDFYAWVAAIGGEVATGAPLHNIPLYAGRVSAGNAGEVVDAPVAVTGITGEILSQAGVHPEGVVALRLRESADSMEPEIPRGSTVFVDTKRGRSLDTFENGGIYAIVCDDGGICIKWVVEAAQQLWFVSANEAYKPKLAWSNNLSEIIAGQVFHFRSTPQKINPRFFKPEG
jgi:hypothetical protein